MSAEHPCIQRLRQQVSDVLPAVSDEWPEAAVLVALDFTPGEPAVILTRRASHLRLHAGEIAFPGGKCDEGDHHYWATALREAEEEIALPPGLIESLGMLQPLLTRTGIRVVPCVGLLRSPVALQANPEELDRVFRAPLEFFADIAELKFDEFDYAGRIRRVPRYEYGEYSVWGITAAVLVKLANIACDAGLEMEDYWRGETT